jgi:hypothetical protein
MSAIDVGVLATLVLFALPVLVAASVFALLLGVEVPKLLCSEKIQSELGLQLVSHQARWSLNENTLPWPVVQLGWAVVTAISLILFSAGTIAKDESLRQIWFIAGAASFTLAASAPFLFKVLFRRMILRLVRGGIVSRLMSVSRAESLLIRKLSLLGSRIETSYAEVNLKTSIQVAEVAKYILINRATGQERDTRTRLTRAIKTLRKFSEEVADHLEGYRQVKRDFDFTKNIVIERGSPTLLAELDRLKLDLDSEEIRACFDRAQWRNLQSKLDQIVFDLKMIRNIAEGGSDLPLSLGQACQTLNVTSTTSLKTAKIVVDALRRVWHPDSGISEEDRERRTIKTTQINVAWEIFAAAFAEEERKTVPNPRRVLELA